MQNFKVRTSATSSYNKFPIIISVLDSVGLRLLPVKCIHEFSSAVSDFGRLVSDQQIITDPIRNCDQKLQNAGQAIQSDIKIAIRSF